MTFPLQYICRQPHSLLLFRRSGIHDDAIVEVCPAESDAGIPGIRCPLCRWRPRRSDRWFCASMGPPENFVDGCGERWNTFETRGVCPGCSHHWVWTSCLGCGQKSRHLDWYE